MAEPWRRRLLARRRGGGPGSFDGGARSAADVHRPIKE
jgi:hypothetical protein